LFLLMGTVNAGIREPLKRVSFAGNSLATAATRRPRANNREPSFLLAGTVFAIPVGAPEPESCGMFRFSWVMVDPQERQILLEGMDFVELAADGRLDGRLQRITGFFGAFPPIPESWPEHLVWRGA
jgi:hypothetical protein